MSVSIVIPTVGRLSLAAVLSALAAGKPPSQPLEILIVDDRPDRQPPPAVPEVHGVRPVVLAGHGSGPAAARNLGWRAARHRWIGFLDDDVVPDPDWFDRLAEDLAMPPQVGGVQGRVRVPLPDGHRATDWERSTAGLATGRWITADMAFRREALITTGGFDERFPRAFREDADLAYRVRCAGWELVRGNRTVAHPVRPEGPWISLRTQRGNADDALLRRVYSPRWRTLLEVPPGRRRRHVLITTAGGAALLAAATAVAIPRWRRAATVAAAAATAGWLAGTAEFAAARIRPGPRTAGEVSTMVITSIAIPPLAIGHWLRGWWASRGEKSLMFTSSTVREFASRAESLVRRGVVRP